MLEDTLPVTTHYNTLKVAQDAPPEVIHAAYAALCKEHQDNAPMLQTLGSAFKVLSDSLRKKEYDMRLHQKNSLAGGETKPDKALANAHAWVVFAAKSAEDAKRARALAVKAAIKAAEPATEKEKAMRSVWAAQAEKDAVLAEEKAEDAAQKAAKLNLQPDTGQKRPALATHYDTLKIARDAPHEVIRAIYVMMAQKYHPDRNSTDPDAGAIMQTINVSYRILSHPQKRADHDAWIRSQEQPQQQPSAAASPGASPAKPAQGPASAKALAAKAWAEKTAKEAVEAENKARKAAADAKEKAAEKDAAVWERWAAKLAIEAQEARRRAERAAHAATDR